MQLAILIAVICALAQGDVAGEPVGSALGRAALTLGGMLLAPLAATFGSLRLARSLTAAEKPAAICCEVYLSRLQAAVVFLWLAAIGGTMYLIEWPRVVRSDWNLARWPLVDELLVLVPVVLPLLLVWTAFYQLQHAVQLNRAQRLGIAAPRAKLLAYLGLHARHHLGLVLGPALVVIGLQETFRLLWPTLETSGQSWWLYGPLLVAMLVVMPLAVRRLWRTMPLEKGPLRERLLSLCRQQRAGVREILIWQTDGHVVNAAVAGVVPGLRYVFLTDALLLRLSPDEVAAVVRHELGHVRGRHLPLRLMLLALPVVAWLGLKAAFPATMENQAEILEQIGIPHEWQMSLLVPAGLALYAMLVVGRYSRWLEHEADLATCVSPEGVVDLQAADDFERSLRKVAGSARESRLTQWLHPSVASRIAFLQAAACDPALAHCFRQRLKVVAWGLGAAYLATSLLVFV